MEDKKEILLSYLKINVVPVLVDFIFGCDFDKAVVLPANTMVNELNGHYDNMEYVPPKWFNDLLSINGNKLLVIDKIDTISKEEQKKFIEILKYKKISTFDLPSECRIIVTANEIDKDKIDEEILSLVARI